MEIRKDMPEEVKNEMINGKQRVITEKVPEKYMKKLQENNKKKQELLNKMLKVSVKEVDVRQKLANIRKEQEDIGQQIINNRNSVQQILSGAFKKLKLGKRKEYNWQFKQNSFVGVYNPPKPKK